MTIALYIFFAINLFVAGYSFSEWEWASTRRERISILVEVFACILGGTLIHLSIFLWSVLVAFWTYLDTTFQVVFWFRYIFTNSVDRMTEEQLKFVNLKAYVNKDSKKLKVRIWRYGVKLINKKRNYTYVHEEHSF